MNDADALMAEAEEAFSRISRVRSDGRPDKAVIAKGATQAATICASSELVSPKALGLVKGFCSLHVVGLKAVASAIDIESDKIRQGKPGHDRVGGRAVQLLRVLIAALNSFLGNARNNTHGTREDVELLDRTVAVIRRTIDNLAEELNDPKAGMAAARLRGLTAMACFGRLGHSPGVQSKDAKSWTENLVRMGTRDVDKLLKCISRQSKKDRASLYLRNPGSCLEALAALRRVATAVPDVYPKVAQAFADAVKCLGGGSEREWGNRPSLRDETVRHTLVACSSHLAERVGRAPKDARLDAYNVLSTALRERPDIRTGGRVSGKPPASGSAEVRSLLESAQSDENPGRGADARVARTVETVHRARVGTGLGGGTPSERSMAPPERAKTPAAFAAVPAVLASAVKPRERSARSCDEAPSKTATPAATLAVAAARVEEDSAEPRVTGTLKRSRSPPEIAEKRQAQAPDDVATVTSPQKLLAPAKAVTAPKLSPATAWPSKDGGRSGRAAKASIRCEPSPRQHPPPALTTTLTTAVEDLREEQRAAEPPAPSERKGGHPLLKTKLDGDSPSLTARPSKDGGRSGRAAKASTRCEPSPRQHPPPALTTTLTTAVEDLREEQRAGEPPAPSERKGGHPPLKTKLDGDSPSLTARPSKDGGRSGRAAKASTRCEPSPRQHPPPALTTTLTTAVEDLREEQRAGEPPAPSERKGGHPPLKTKLDGDSPSLTARPSKDGGRSGRAAKASTRCEPSPRQHPPPALTTTLTTAVEDLREEQRVAEPPAPSERKGGHPPLKTKLDGDSPSLTARPSKDGGRSGRAAKASTRCEPSPRQHPPPALTTTLTTAVEDLREEQRAGEPPAPSERKGGHPPLKTKLDGDSPSLTARPSKDGGRSGRAAKASTRCEPSPRQHPPPALTTTLTTAVEDLREEQRVAEPPAPSERKGGHPPLKTKLDGDSPDWREGERYEVLLGESFYREGGGGGGGGNSGGKNDSRVHYAHLKYDFIPGRTNLDAPAALRQGPFAGAGVKADVDSQRWAAEMVYESRDPENPRPVRFSGDAARAQDVECVLVFDGNMFVMEKVSVVGGLKNAQDFSGPAVRSAGGATLEVSMARRKRKEARPKNGPRDKNDQQKQQRAKPQEQQTKQQQPNNKKFKAGGGQAADGSHSSAPGEGGEKTGSVHRASASISSNAANTGVSVNPANMLSQTKRREKDSDLSPLETSSGLNSGS